MKNSKKRLARLLCAAMAAAMVLAGCNSSGGNSSSTSAGQGGEEQVLNIYTWADYFPADIVEEFTSTTGIKVNYSTFESNEEMLMKLEAAKGGQYDLILASDYIIETAIQKELVGKLDTQQIPNFQNINPAFQSKYYDPTNEYTVPYAAGIPLIIYNPELVDFEIKGFEDLWNPQLADSIVVMDDARNVIGLTLKSMGYSLNETDEAVLGQAKEKLMALKPNIRALDYSTPYNLMISGETAVGYMFTSQIITALNENPDLKVVYPEEGLGFGIDSCFVPSDAPHKENAYKFLDFILDGERSAHISEETMYINCNSAATPFIKEQALVIPDEMIEGAEFMMNVGEADELYQQIWTEFKMS